VASPGIVEPLDKVEDGHAGHVAVLEDAPVDELALQGGEELSAMALSKQSPTEPMDRSTPAARQALAKS
jgi:hypothetical protein